MEKITLRQLGLWILGLFMDSWTIHWLAMDCDLQCLDQFVAGSNIVSSIMGGG